ncbi:MAG: phosphoribosylformylglycinamidine synthase subunit PurQ, partial [Nitrospirota bacterium]
PHGKSDIVKAPGTLVVSAYVTCPDITRTVTPDLKKPGSSRVLYIDLGKGNIRLGGTSLAHVYGQIGNDSPDLEDPQLLKRTFDAVQDLIAEDMILAGHDRSDGGLLVTLLEMAFGGNCGIDVNIQPPHPPLDKGGMGGVELPLLFSEELGVVIEYLPENEDRITSLFKENDIPYQMIGKTIEEKEIRISINDTPVLKEDMRVLRAVWEETSYHLDRLQADRECVEEERKANFERRGPQFRIGFTPQNTSDILLRGKTKPKVAVIREEGSNGDREMSSAFHLAGFEVWDVAMTDLLSGRAGLDGFRGVAFVGGFSYADVLDSAKGWAGVIKFNRRLYEQFEEFYARPDTFSLGVCNGCQLLALLGWVPWKGIPDATQPRFIRNRSGRFESRFPAVRILKSPSIMLRGMEGSILGVWVAHGEGRLYFPKMETLEEVLERDLAPVRFVDDDGEFTEIYPFNPNGSPGGITALCSPDGKHLALMPHPERTFLKWQWAYIPGDWKNLEASPWLRMFQNAREWCEEL